MWLRWGRAVILLALAVPGALFLLIATPAGESGGGWMVAGGILVLVMLAVLALGINLAGVDVDAAVRAQWVSDAPVRAALLERWLRRSRHFRFVGGLTGFIIGLGLVDNGDLWVAIVGALIGVAVGGAAAEVHSLTGGRRGTRSAELVRRRLLDYVSPIDAIALVAIGAAAAAVLVAGVVNAGGGTGPAVAAVVAVGLVALMLRLVVMRPRPALDPELREADDLMRRLAATRGFTRPGIAVALVLLAWAMSAAGWTDAVPGIDVVLVIIGLAWWLASRQTRRSLVAAGR
jgi:hypothetical protein